MSCSSFRVNGLKSLGPLAAFVHSAHLQGDLFWMYSVYELSRAFLIVGSIGELMR